MADAVDDELLADLYGWVDTIPLTRPKKDIKRDFADGVMVAEIVKHFCPRLMELHNYAPANSQDKRKANWSMLNRKPFKKLGFEVSTDVVKNIIAGKPMAIEQFLMLLRRKIDRHLFEQRREKLQDAGNGYDARPEADQPPAGSISPMSERYSPGKKSVPPRKARNVPEYAREFATKAQQPRSDRTSPTRYRNQGIPNQKTYRLGTKHEAPVYEKPSPRLHHRGAQQVVPKIQLEEKEQELLSKDETIQILQAKVRRLEHLLHLKDIRIDDLQTRMDRLESQLRPTQQRR